ncbi:MAG: hypothetical protein RIQ93_966, partial [Verrucomicrobiota bacterium]
MNVYDDLTRSDVSPSVVAMPPALSTPPADPPRSRRNALYLQVLIGIVLGGMLGYFAPGVGVKLKP